MKFLICVVYLFLLTTHNLNAQTAFPKTNYSPGDCIINVSPNSSWFAKHARVNDSLGFAIKDVVVGNYQHNLRFFIVVSLCYR